MTTKALLLESLMLVLEGGDYDDQHGNPGGLVDFASIIAPLICGRRSVGGGKLSWHASYKGNLASAVSGGQWSRARKAAVPDWGIDDPNCQLCNASIRTLEHRFCCTATTPVGGWPSPPEAAQLFSSMASHAKGFLPQEGFSSLDYLRPNRTASQIFIGYWNLSWTTRQWRMLYGISMAQCFRGSGRFIGPQGLALRSCLSLEACWDLDEGRRHTGAPLRQLQRLGRCISFCRSAHSRRR